MAPVSYLPGHDGAAARMLGARTAAGRASFVPTAGRRVLDVGCGPGTITSGFATSARAVVGIEPAAAPAAAAATRLPGRIVRAEVDALPVADGAVDVVVAHALVEHLPDVAAALAEMRRVLRPDGHLALIASDWSGAVVEPPDEDAAGAIEAYRAARSPTRWWSVDDAQAEAAHTGRPAAVAAAHHA